MCGESHRQKHWHVLQYLYIGFDIWFGEWTQAASRMIWLQLFLSGNNSKNCLWTAEVLLTYVLWEVSDSVSFSHVKQPSSFHFSHLCVKMYTVHTCQKLNCFWLSKSFYSRGHQEVSWKNVKHLQFSTCDWVGNALLLIDAILAEDI